jgi:3-oxoacyl-[acyl-carrier-protein] synthase-3
VPLYSSIVHAAVHAPPGRQSVAEAEDRFRSHSPHISLSPGVLAHMYGLAERTVAPADEQPSDLAAHSARRLFEAPGVTIGPSDIDLLIFAGILADMEEPATAHLVADRLGLNCPVFDLKNACNGVLNAIEVADALIKAGQYRRVLVTTAEVSTRESRWSVDDPADVLTALPSLSTGDMGSALLLEASERPGVIGSRFFANSWGWPAATLPNPYTHHRAFGELRIDSAQLVESFAGMPAKVREAIGDLGVKVDELDLVCVHQPSVAFTKVVCEWVGVDPDRVLATFPSHGNVATNTMPLQLATALDTGRLGRGDLVGMFGFASGASAGVVVCEW